MQAGQVGGEADRLEFSVLGPLRGWRGAAALPLGGPQQQGLLAALLLRLGGTAGADELIGSLWGDEPPRAAMTTVRTYAYRLRKVLEAEPAQPAVLVSTGDGYRMVLPPPALDLRRAEELAAAAETRTSAGEPDQARALLDEALGLWRGEPLAGIPGPFADRQRRRLSELRLTLLEERLALEVAFGRPTRCVPELTALTAEHPLRERPYGLLMWALYRSGRQADALALYRSLRGLLLEELGVEPGSELVELHREILNGATELPARLLAIPQALQAPRTTPLAQPPVESAPEQLAEQPRPELPRPAQLPPDIADFTGRSAEVALIRDALGAPARSVLPVVVLAGMGGVGKTALAVHAAHRAREAFPGGELYADLRGADPAPADPADVLAGFLAALGIPPRAVPETLTERSALFRSAVDGRRVLIVLDNARDSTQVRPLLPGAPDCAVLVTGRTLSVNRLPAVLQLDVGAFDTPEALELLDRVLGPERRAAEPTEALELVRACGFLPLAVRVVATRLAARPGWSIRSLSQRLADERGRIDELRIGELTVAAAFELGYRQLTVRQAEAFRMVSWAEGPELGLAAAAAMLEASEPETEVLLEGLVDAAMLESPSAGRYRCHDLLRVFARSHSVAQPGTEPQRARTRLLGHLMAGACTALQLALPGDPLAEWLGEGLAPVAGPALPDLPSVRRWALLETAGTVALAHRMAGDATDEVELRAAIDLLLAFGPLDRAAAGAGAETAARALIAGAERLGDRRAEGRARFLRGTILLAATRLANARGEARLAVLSARTCGDTMVLRQALNDLGLIAQALRQHEEAIACFEESVTLADQLGHRSGALASRVNAALSRLRAGQPEAAADTCEQLLPELRELGDAQNTAYALYVLGLALDARGSFTAAARRFEECIAQAMTAGRPDRESLARTRLADTLRALGRPGEAAREAERAVRISTGMGAGRDRGYALVALGRALWELGEHGAAHDRLREAQLLLERLGLPEATEVGALLGELTVRA